MWEEEVLLEAAHLLVEFVGRASQLLGTVVASPVVGVVRDTIMLCGEFQVWEGKGCGC